MENNKVKKYGDRKEVRTVGELQLTWSEIVNARLKGRREHAFDINFLPSIKVEEETGRVEGGRSIIILFFRNEFEKMRFKEKDYHDEFIQQYKKRGQQVVFQLEVVKVK